MTVQELIDNLKHFDPNMEVKYTLGGSSNFNNITYIDEENDGYYDNKGNWISDVCVVIGKLTW